MPNQTHSQKWCAKLGTDLCQMCQQSNIPHLAKGLCRKCYFKRPDFLIRERHRKRLRLKTPESRAAANRRARASRERRKSTPAFKAAKRISDRNSYEKNRQKRIAYSKEWRRLRKQSDPEKFRLETNRRAREWRLRHRDDPKFKARRRSEYLREKSKNPDKFRDMANARCRRSYHRNLETSRERSKRNAQKSLARILSRPETSIPYRNKMRIRANLNWQRKLLAKVEMFVNSINLEKDVQ